MKVTIQSAIILIGVSMTLLTSCRKEEIERIQTTPNENLDPNSLVANLMKRTVTNDGSIDNILDFANCFHIKLPVTVSANTVAITINTDMDYELVEAVFDEEYDDVNSLEISFPITIIQRDFSEATITDLTELNSFSANCNGENEDDDDIECIDMLYPISASTFNTNNEMIGTETFLNDSALYTFIENISTNDIVRINFPISVRLFDATEIEIFSLSELQSTIQDVQNICDEDDDYDYDDDDCNDCTTDNLANYLTGCSDWQVNKLKRNSTDYDDAYDGYDFNFFTDGTLSVFWNSITVYGTWTTAGTANNITVILDVPNLPLCNAEWHLQEIENNDSDTKLDLRVGNEDRLRYENTCN